MKRLIGQNVIIRTVTMIFTGKLTEITEEAFVLKEAAWIPDTERWAQFIALGAVRECEPYPDDTEVFVSKSSFVDICKLLGKLPRIQK